MFATRRVHLVVVAVTASVMLLGFGLGSAALAQSSEEQPTQRVIPAGSVTLQAIPSSVPETGGEVELAAIVRDDRGRPLENAQVNFLATTGTLVSGGRLVATGADGGVVDRLTLTAAELAAVGEDSFQLAVAVGSDGVALRTANAGVRIQRAPQAGFRHDAGGFGGGLRRCLRRPGHRTDSGTSTTAPRAPARARLTPSLSRGSTRSHCAAANSVGSDEVTRLIWVQGVRGAWRVARGVLDALLTAFVY